MLQATNIALSYGKRVIFKDVNIKFTHGNCYGLIGANGAGKSTFLRILAGQKEPDKGEVSIGPRERIAVLQQDQFVYDEETVLDTVIRGHKRLYDLRRERELLYAQAELSEADGIRCGDLEIEFGELNGYEAEAEAGVLLSGLGIGEDLAGLRMKELEAGDKVRVLLAQALFGNPDILLLDEPTNNLDVQSIAWLEEFLIRFTNTVIIVSHDRHFLNQVCTHVADIDFGQIRVYVGNYDFWYQASQLVLTQRQRENTKSSAKAAELKEFIQRFSSNASKAKQATARKKLLEKITVEETKKLLGDWETRKRLEKNRKYLLSGVSKDLPSLLLACIIQRKVGSHGLTEALEDGALSASCAEEIKAAADGKGAVDKELSVGRFLFALDRVIHAEGVEPELALHRYARYVMDQLRAFEKGLFQRGKSLMDISPEEAQVLWQDFCRKTDTSVLP